MATRPAEARPATTTRPAEAPAAAAAPPGFDPARWLNEQLDKQVEYRPFMSEESIKLSARLVLRFLCTPTKSGKVCTEEQALKFVMLCRSRALNPWEGDAYIVGYDGQDGPTFSLITAHQAFLKRAEAHKEFDGMESGVLIVRKRVTPAGEELEEELELDGDYHRPDDVLVGGWATVHRRDRKYPTIRRVRLATFSTGRSRWAKDPAGMIVKCAEADALRSAFPNNLAGLHLEGEIPTAAEDFTPDAATPAARPSAAEVLGRIKGTARPPGTPGRVLPAAASSAPAEAGAGPVVEEYNPADPETDPFAGPGGADRERDQLEATK